MLRKEGRWIRLEEKMGGKRKGGLEERWEREGKRGVMRKGGR